MQLLWGLGLQYMNGKREADNSIHSIKYANICQIILFNKHLYTYHVPGTVLNATHIKTCLRHTCHMVSAIRVFCGCYYCYYAVHLLCVSQCVGYFDLPALWTPTNFCRGPHCAHYTKEEAKAQGAEWLPQDKAGRTR